ESLALGSVTVGDPATACKLDRIGLGEKPWSMCQLNVGPYRRFAVSWHIARYERYLSLGMSEESDLKQIMVGKPTRLESQFRLTYTMILHLLRVEELKIDQVRLLEDPSNVAYSKTVQQLLEKKRDGNKYPPALDAVKADHFGLHSGHSRDCETWFLVIMLYDTAIRLGQLQSQFKLAIDPVEYARENLKFGLVEVVYEWAKGTPFADICELTDVPEGLIVRTIVRLDETCREFKNAASIMGNTALYKKMETASNAIKRDIVFAATELHGPPISPNREPRRVRSTIPALVVEPSTPHLILLCPPHASASGDDPFDLS
ncbi:hypothetical protein BHM03_00040679, partial [Ensete ventricosum]